MSIPKEVTDRWDAEAAAIDKEIMAHEAARRQCDGSGWPVLIPLDQPELPAVDPMLLPEWAGTFAASLAESTETPPELAVAMVLATCATATARRFRVQVHEGYSELSNAWLLIALPPGSRKSAVQSASARPLIDWEGDQAESLKGEIAEARSDRETAEARAKEFRRRAAKANSADEAREHAERAAEIEANLPEVPIVPRLWTSDATPERLGGIMADQGECMAWLSSEGGIFDLLAGRYSGGIPNLDLVLKAWSGDPDRVDRGGRPPVYLARPRLTIGLSPQPEMLRGLTAKPGFRGRGLLARFMYLLPKSPLGFRTLEPRSIRPGIQSAYDRGIRAMLNWPDEELPAANLSSEAHSEWLAFARTIERGMAPGGELAHFTDWAGKAPGSAARLAGILHGIEHAHGVPWEVPISGQTMAKALDLMAIITRHSLAALSLMGSDPVTAAAMDVWGWIESGRQEAVTAREVYQARRGTLPRMAQVKAALDLLAERGYVEIFEPPRDGPGRPPSPTVIVNPSIVKGWQ